MLGTWSRTVAEPCASVLLAQEAALSQHQVSFVANATEHFFQKRMGDPVEIFLKLTGWF
ncbi:hypothetical protein [Burkholderia cepacia]|uniref:hypothetical protein n=1 Tax=Burkholderia cepacia TaxID=292 RepID=UPI00398F741D